ncbi:hypothetical protein D3C85_1391520 [compost metagenome]
MGAVVRRGDESGLYPVANHPLMDLTGGRCSADSVLKVIAERCINLAGRLQRFGDIGCLDRPIFLDHHLVP